MNQERLDPARLEPGVRNQALHLKALASENLDFGDIVTFAPGQGRTTFRKADPRDLAGFALGMFVVTQAIMAGTEGDAAFMATIGVPADAPVGSLLYLWPGGQIDLAVPPESYPVVVGSITEPGKAILNPPPHNQMTLYLMIEG